MTIWQILGIEPTDDVVQIRRAYAKQLKLHRPDSDPKGYQQLRQAFEQAKALAEGGVSEAPPADMPEKGEARAIDSTDQALQHASTATGGTPERQPPWTEQDIAALVSELADSEVRGAAALDAVWRRVTQSASLAQQQRFHQQLGRVLAELPGLTEGLLERV